MRIAVPTILLSLVALGCSLRSDGAVESSSATGAGGTGGSNVHASAGPVAVSSGSGASSAATSSGGAADPDWISVEWQPNCPLEVASNPAAAFPQLEWTSCPNGERGCETIVKNWDPYLGIGGTIHAVRRTGEGHEISMSVVAGKEGREMMVAFGPDGTPRHVFRLGLSSCVMSRLLPARGGWWYGVQEVTKADASSTYAFLAAGAPIDAAELLPFDLGSQRQAGGPDLFVIERSYGAGLRIFDRASGAEHAFDVPATHNPTVVPGGVLFRRSTDVGPTLWAWDRATGQFGELMNGGDDVVVNAHSDGAVLAWTAGAPYDGVGARPRHTLYTSPHTLDPAAIVPTARWTNLVEVGVSDAVIGGGHYAVIGDSGQSTYILRLADGRRWTVPTPLDEFDSPVKQIGAIDEEYYFFALDRHAMRIRLDVLGEGLPPE